MVLKITLAIFMAIATMVHAAPANSSEETVDPTKDWLHISEYWLLRYGCPREGPFMSECNTCHCDEARTIKGSCTLKYCETNVFDAWKEGTVSTCEPGIEFYSKCSHCTCDESGTSATCDDRACEFYQNLEQDQDQDVETTTQLYDF